MCVNVCVYDVHVRGHRRLSAWLYAASMATWRPEHMSACGPETLLMFNISDLT